VALQPGQIAWSLIDAKALGRFMPPVFAGTRAHEVPALARAIGLDEHALQRTVERYNAACRTGHFDHTVLDDCRTQDLSPPKTHWALPIDTPPFHAYALRPGLTFTYLGLEVDDTAAVRFAGRASPNLYAAGELMAGNVLGQGYTAGVGMSIGTAFGRIAGAQAARAAAHASGHGASRDRDRAVC
jgi:tricarballylate dehydrogenase